MQKSFIKKFVGTPFSIKTVTIPNGPGVWDSTKISIFRDDIQIGEYIRNYPTLANTTFYPFFIGDQWYALYSANYTASRVMKLGQTDIEDWCGEESNTQGFCPAEFYVPQYHKFSGTIKKDNTYETYYYYSTDSEYETDEEYMEEGKSIDYVETGYVDFGFLSGCQWGDDSSWKLRYIDLSEIPNKVLKIEEKFGYWELPSLPLKKCVDLSNWSEDHQWADLVRKECVKIKG